MNHTTETRYQQRIDAVIQYIYQQLAAPSDSDLSLDRLSEIACFSKFHFHRIFFSIVGMSSQQFIQRIRLKKAAYQLAFLPDMKVVDIAFDTGFENHESFSRAFKNTYHQTPSQFRLQPNWPQWTEQQPNQLNQEHCSVKVNTVQFPSTLVASLTHHGSPKRVNQTVAQFIEWRKSSHESPIATTDTFGVAYNDPATTPDDEFKFEVCSSVEQPIKTNSQGVLTKTIPGGRCAQITHHGSHDLMDEKIRYLYQQWIIENNETLRDFPCFFKYLNLFPQVSEHELITEIYLPLK